mmetsp:Transcript_44593/g.104184  ORF Transcript_44593/g.104184 Transcript_44593/m.104184 type:complete len:218 (-) Transcript_44593:132-785(-)
MESSRPRASALLRLSHRLALRPHRRRSRAHRDDPRHRRNPSWRSSRRRCQSIPTSASATETYGRSCRRPSSTSLGKRFRRLTRWRPTRRLRPASRRLTLVTLLVRELEFGASGREAMASRSQTIWDITSWRVALTDMERPLTRLPSNWTSRTWSFRRWTSALPWHPRSAAHFRTQWQHHSAWDSASSPGRFATKGRKSARPPSPSARKSVCTTLYGR